MRDKSAERRRQGLFAVEGAREINMAISGGYVCDTLFVCLELISDEIYSPLRKSIMESDVIEVSRKVFEKIAYREGSDGLLALMRIKNETLQRIKIGKNPFVIILESVEKPGNLGAILRTADAAAVDAVLICDPRCDIFNPNVIRSSLGCVFSTPIAACSSQEALLWLKEHKIKTFAAELTASILYHKIDFTSPSAIIMGTESSGLSDFWLQNADARIKIPMLGKVDSLNVSVSTAIITYEAVRQRNFEANSHLSE
ncbi:MAG: RNA methyltransferase [Prevotellaceae bacterium]|nr:RNA methyltransferase [Prevotellaceae bacterium]